MTWVTFFLTSMLFCHISKRGPLSHHHFWLWKGVFGGLPRFKHSQTTASCPSVHKNGGLPVSDRRHNTGGPHYLLAEPCFQIFPVKTGNVVDGYVLGAFHLAGAGVGAVTKTKFVHLCNHGAGAACGLGLALRQESQ